MELLQSFNFFNAFPVSHYRWPNGLQALLVKNPISPVVAYLTHYTVGSAWESADQRGLAHFFEHMMFRETEKYREGEMDRILAEAGGVGLNASTSLDTTQYYVNVPTAYLSRVVELEADRMVNLQLVPEQIEKERGAVLGEMNMYKDMPSDQFYNALMAAAFPHHPYRHPVIGYVEQVAAFKTEDFTRFYRQHYAPNRAIVIVAGGFDESEVLALLEGAYAGLQPGLPRPQPAPPEPPLPAAVRVELTHEKISTENLALGVRSPGLTHPDAPALMLLSAVLSAGKSSPLHRRIVLEGLGTSASAGLMDTDYPLVSPGLFMMDVDLQQGVPAERAEQALQGLLDALDQEGIPAQEIERARNQVRLGVFLGLTTNMSLARQVGRYLVACGDPRYGETLISALERVTAQDLQRVLRETVLAPGRVTVIQRPAPASSKAAA